MIKDFDVAFEESNDDILGIVKGSIIVDDRLAEVIGHSFNKEPHVLKNLYLTKKYNFECEMIMTDAQEKQTL